MVRLFPRLCVLALCAVILSAATVARAAPPATLTLYAAGTLAVPFKEMAALFTRKYPAVTVEPRFGGSVMMAKRITELGQAADILAVADYSVIPKYLLAAGKPKKATWYVGFARNAITFVYTPQSKYAKEITPANWYEVLARPGVEIGRSNPDTDPSGYQTLQMLSLAEHHYGKPGLAKAILANASRANMRDTETNLIAALQLGQIDYLAIYRSDALQHHLESLALPREINLSDPALAALYAHGIAHTRNGTLAGRPIVYALTIPTNAPDARWAEKFVALLLGPEGRAVLKKNGFGTVLPALAVGRDAMPAGLRPLVEPWPQS